MTFQKPHWINKEFLKKAIQNGNDSHEATVESFEVDMPVPKGNNYGSDIYGVRAKYTKSNDSNNTHEISLIIKGQVNGFASEMVVETGAADKEAMVYKEFAPKLESLFSGNDKSYDEEDNNIFPKFYFSCEQNVVIVEDLKCKGYRMADKLKQLDFDHCKTALRALAKFHAGSLVIQEKEPELIRKLSKETTEGKSMEDWFTNSLTTTFTIIAEEFEKLPALRKYSKWFEQNSKTAGRLYIDNLTKSKEDEFKVLNHGDFWLTNMLFKTTDNKPPRVKLIDLQCCRYTSPAVDFLEFIETSAQDDVWANKYDDLIMIYLNEFNSILERHRNPKRLTESEFKKSIADRPHYRITLNTFMLSFVLADSKEVNVVNREEFTQDLFANMEQNPIREYVKNPKYLDIITKRIKVFERNGIISSES